MSDRKEEAPAEVGVNESNYMEQDKKDKVESMSDRKEEARRQEDRARGKDIEELEQEKQENVHKIAEVPHTQTLDENEARAGAAAHGWVLGMGIRVECEGFVVVS